MYSTTKRANKAAIDRDTHDDVTKSSKRDTTRVAWMSG
jgi:hypothetical protein